MQEKLKDAEKRYIAIEEELATPEVFSDQSRYASLMKDYKALTPVIEKYREYVRTSQMHDDARAMLDDAPDPELKELISEEIKETRDRMEALTEELKILLLPRDENDGKNVMVDLHLCAPGIEEAYEKAKMSGEMYLTGQGAFLYTKLFVNEMITQKGLISSDMLDDEQVEQYLAWAAELGITYNIEIKEGVVCED